MQFISTRGGKTVSATAAIMQGIASNGGLFIPKTIPSVELSELVGLNRYVDVATKIMKLFLDEIPLPELELMTKAVYSSFDTPDVAPVIKLSQRKSVTELWHGPTMAFKDIALQMLPRLVRYCADKEGNDKEICILVATSGDTGKAALEGFKDVENTKVIVFYPHNGVSKIQRLQMVTQQGNNIAVCGVEGNFDDAQTALKRVFCDEAFNAELNARGQMLSSANSINFGRLLPQIVYYFTSYISLVNDGAIQLGDEINFCVPTGNFGDILAGHYAKKMGLPIHKLICASNQNRVLTDFLQSGEYNVNRDFYKSMSCSIDILISSNFERYLYELCDENTEQVSSHMASLREHGKFTISEEQLKKAQAEFVGYCCTEEETLTTIASTFRKAGYLIDPHTAVAMFAADKYEKQTGDERHMVVHSTASPYKFASSVLSAFEEPAENDFANIDRLNRLTKTPIPKPLSELKNGVEKHTDVIPIGEMKNYIGNKLGEAKNMETNDRKRSRKRIVVSIAILATVMIASIFCTSIYYRQKYEKLLPISEAMGLVEDSFYFYEQNEIDLQTAALRGIAANIGDDYAQYFTEEEYQQLLESNSGTFYGIGISVVREDVGVFYIHAVFEDSPAEEAGIAVGDRLISINGTAADGLELTPFLDNFVQEEKFFNTIVVEREGKELSFSLEMREVYSPYVFHEMLDDEVGYILITGFHGECVAEVDAAIEDLQQRGMKKLILDLRDNLGGSLNIVTEVAGRFLPEGSIVTTVKNRTEDEQVYKTSSEGIAIPMAVLVNNYSASASELLSGALHDHGVATLFGEVTYGKGIVQSYYHLSGSNGYLKFTSDAYYTPNGVCIQGTGIEPDVEVPLDEKWSDTAVSLIPHDEDNQLQTALNYLKNGE